MKCGCDKRIEKELKSGGLQNARMQGFAFDFDEGLRKILNIEFLYNRINPKTLNYYRQDYVQSVKAKYCPFCGEKL